MLGYDSGEARKSDYEKSATSPQELDKLMIRDKKGRACFDEKTEVFTNAGWKYFKDLKGDELILTRKYNGDTEWSSILDKQQYYYQKNMYHIKTKGIDLKVTPEHSQCLIPSKWSNTSLNIKKETNYKFQKISNLTKINKITNYYNIPKTFRWKGIDIKYFVLPFSEYFSKNRNNILDLLSQDISIKQISKTVKCHVSTVKYFKNYYKLKQNIKISMKNWCAFLGLYLSEGSISYRYKTHKSYVIQIAQKHTQEKDKYIENILNKLPFKFRKIKKGYICNNKSLYNYLTQFGKAKDKFIPQEIKNLSKKYLKLLLDTLTFGDGHIMKNKIVQYTTISRPLANDVQEIAYKCGYNAEIYYRAKRKPHIWNNLLFIPRHPQWVVQFNKSSKRGNHQQIYLRNLIRYKHIKKIKYNGFVYDITINNHVLWIRRNNKCIWSGNCTHFYQNLPTKNGEMINHRGIGKISYYNTKCRTQNDFEVYKNAKVKIYNVSLNSKIPDTIFEKISYDQFFAKLDNKYTCQPCLRKYIKERLK